MASRVGTRAEALMVLEGDEVVSERHGIEPGTGRATRSTCAAASASTTSCGHVITETTQGASLLGEALAVR